MSHRGASNLPRQRREHWGYLRGNATSDIQGQDTRGSAIAGHLGKVFTRLGESRTRKSQWTKGKIGVRLIVPRCGNCEIGGGEFHWPKRVLTMQPTGTQQVPTRVQQQCGVSNHFFQQPNKGVRVSNQSSSLILQYSSKGSQGSPRVVTATCIMNY